jgi:hypothetical protein
LLLTLPEAIAQLALTVELEAPSLHILFAIKMASPQQNFFPDWLKAALSFT